MATSIRPEILDRLTEGIAQLTTSRAWQGWLDVQRRFHRYSFGNTMLIHLQRPDASYVAGFHTWLRLGRRVRKGEKGIAILAPIVRRLRVENQNGEDQVIVGAPRNFKPASVFDLSQTEGDHLPEISSRLVGDDPRSAFVPLVEVAASVGFAVELVDEFPDARNGDCSHGDHRIRLRRHLAPAQRVKTLAHELAHAVLHGPNCELSERGLKELEAESVAYVVCNELEIDSSSYSFGYVAGWAGGGPEATKAISACGQRIVKAARLIVDGGYAAEEGEA
jgi:antirestriction protein ArdC